MHHAHAPTEQSAKSQPVESLSLAGHHPPASAPDPAFHAQLAIRCNKQYLRGRRRGCHQGATEKTLRNAAPTTAGDNRAFANLLAEFRIAAISSGRSAQRVSAALK